MDLEELLGCNVDVVSDRGLRPKFRDQSRRDGHPLNFVKRDVGGGAE